MIFPSLPAGHTASQPTGHHSQAFIAILLPSAASSYSPSHLQPWLTMETLFGNNANTPQLLQAALSQLAGRFPKRLHFPTLPRRQQSQANTASSSGKHGHRASVP